MGTVHVVGAGLAGLACALRLASAGRAVRLYEASTGAGGRCRSFDDPSLGVTLDNGAHVLVGANRHACGFLQAVGTADLLAPVDPLPFRDLRSGAAWSLPAGFMGLLHVPQALRAMFRLALAGNTSSVATTLAATPQALERLFGPLTAAILNTPPATASARLLAAVLARVALAGPGGARVLVPQAPLAEVFVAPALRRLAAHGVRPRFHHRLQRLSRSDDRVRALVFSRAEIALAPTDRVVLALPWPRLATLLPDIAAPASSHAIVNLHYRLTEPARLPGGGPMLGLIGGTAEWLFARPYGVCVTVSAADALLDRPADTLLAAIWTEIAALLGGGPCPPGRVVKERRATFAQTPAILAARPSGRSPWRGVVLAGDATAHGLPATIEAAIRSGERAARMLLA